MNRTMFERLLLFVLWFSFAAILTTVQTSGCLTKPGRVYVVSERACVPERAFVPAGWVKP